MSSINSLDQTLIQTIMAASQPSSLFSANALITPARQADSSQLRGLQGLAAEIGNLAGISRQAQATILGAGRLEAAAAKLLPKLRELRGLARQGTAEGLTTEERKTLTERFAALQDEINKETGEDLGNGQIQATLLEQTGTGLVEIGRQTVAGPPAGAAAEPRVRSFDRLGVTAGLDEGYGAGDLNGLEVTVTPLDQADSAVGSTATSETLLNLSVSDQATAEEAVTRLDQAMAGMASLRTQARAARAGQRELILQTARALATAAREQETDSSLAGTILQTTRSLVLQQPDQALSVQDNMFPESVIALLS